MNIGFDCDGVLANFTKAFSTIGNKLFGLPVIEEMDVVHWNWSWNQWYCTQEQEEAMWEEVRCTDFFWRDLEVFDLGVLGSMSRLVAENNVYVVTNRISTGFPRKISAQEQTSNWFLYYGNFVPGVIVSSAKGLLANGLKLDYYIDDKFTYCVDVVKSSPKTRVFMLNKTHNSWIPDKFPSYFLRMGHMYPEITLIDSVDNYISIIRGEDL